MSSLIVPTRGSLTTGELEIKRSRFITWIGRADDGDEARDLIALARAEYPDARHHCSAYIHEVPGANRVERSSDDGEPSGTAGAPMLEVLRGSGLTEVVAVVTRWFGGTLLGTGGLVRAYGDAVRAAVDRARVREVRLLHEIGVVVDPAIAGRVEAELRNRDHAVLDTEWGLDTESGPSVRITVAVAPADRAGLEADLAELTSGTARCQDGPTRWA